MKKITLILTLVTLTSCQSDKIDKLHEKIKKLENETVELKNTIEKIQSDKFTSSYFTTTIESEYLTVGKEEKIKVSLITIDTIPEFNVYSINETEIKLVMEKQNRTEFYYPFTPTSIDDNEINLTAELELLNGTIIVFPIFSKFDVRMK